MVVNRPAAGRSNASKPYQLGLIAQAGFQVPDTLVTTDPAAARAFLREHGRLVYKSLSGIRSIVATLDARDEARLDNVRTGPVQLQAYVAGLDVRVHIVGEQWFACSVRSTAADYRYAGAAGTTAELSAFELPEHVGRQLVALVQGMNLLVAGGGPPLDARRLMGLLRGQSFPGLSLGTRMLQVIRSQRPSRTCCGAEIPRFSHVADWLA